MGGFTLDFAMHDFLFYMAAQLVGYLVGGIPFGYLIAKAKAGIDIREHGSGNIGATNVGRILGLRYFLLVFVLDFLKGAVPVALALTLRARHADPESPTYTQYLCLPELIGVAAILGHMFPVYLNLRGGKGVATSIGVLLLLAPIPALIGLMAWILMVLVSRMVSLGSIVFALAFAVSHVLMAPDPWGHDRALTAVVLLASALVLIRHRQNVIRIFQGTESQVRFPWAR